jgi:hypothetical protein
MPEVSVSYRVAIGKNWRCFSVDFGGLNGLIGVPLAGMPEGGVRVRMQS